MSRVIFASLMLWLTCVYHKIAIRPSSSLSGKSGMTCNIPVYPESCVLNSNVFLSWHTFKFFLCGIFYYEIQIK